jgi:hypothetical protein
MRGKGRDLARLSAICSKKSQGTEPFPSLTVGDTGAAAEGTSGPLEAEGASADPAEWCSQLPERSRCKK